MAYSVPMPNVSPVKYDRLLQFRTDPEFRDKLAEMEVATGTDRSVLLRQAFEEKYARWARTRKKVA